MGLVKYRWLEQQKLKNVYEDLIYFIILTSIPKLSFGKRTHQQLAQQHFQLFLH